MLLSTRYFKVVTVLHATRAGSYVNDDGDQPATDMLRLFTHVTRRLGRREAAVVTERARISDACVLALEAGRFRYRAAQCATLLRVPG